LDTDESLSDAYDPSLVTLLLGEAAWLLRHLGFTAQHTILIGGLVPSLLVLDPPAERHLGTGDLDLCLSLAIVTGDTAEYERLETALTAAGYEPTDFSFRWRQRDGLRLRSSSSAQHPRIVRRGRCSDRRQRSTPPRSTTSARS